MKSLKKGRKNLSNTDKSRINMLRSRLFGPVQQKVVQRKADEILEEKWEELYDHVGIPVITQDLFEAFIRKHGYYANKTQIAKDFYRIHRKLLKSWRNFLENNGKKYNPTDNCLINQVIVDLCDTTQPTFHDYRVTDKRIRACLT